MKTLLAVLAITFSANSFAHGFYLSPSQKLTLSPFMGTFFTIASTDATSLSSAQKALNQVIQDAQEYHQTGIASAALEASIHNVQADQEVSNDEAVDMLVEIAQKALENN